jgi:hypothetical protein
LQDTKTHRLSALKERMSLVENMCARVCHERRGGLVVEGWIDGAVLHRRWRGRPTVGWWASAVALQREAANHREVRRSRTGVLSVAEKARL